MLRNIQFFFILIGFAPFKIEKNGNSKIYYKYTKILKYYNLMLIFGIIVTNIYIIPNVFRDLYKEKQTVFSRLLGLVLSYLSTIVVIILLIIFSVQQQKLIKMTNQFFDVNYTLKRLQDMDTSDTDTIKITWIFYGNILFSTCVVISELFLNEQFFTSFFLYIYQSILLSFYASEYAIVLAMIEKKFKSINNKFLKLKHSINVHLQSGSLRKCSVRKMCIVEVIALKRCHAKLYDLCSKISNFYSFGMLFIIPHCVTCIIIYIYDLLIPFIKYYMFSNLILRRASQYAWMLMILFPILIVAMIATKIKKQVSDFDFIFIDNIFYG